MVDPNPDVPLSSTSLLWHLQPPGAQPCWLFGSMHIRDQRVHQFGQGIYPFIEQSDVYIGEMELEVREELELSSQYDLKKHFSESAFDKIRKQLYTSLQFDIEPFIFYHPLVILSAISQKILAAEHQVSLDEHLWQFARKQLKPAFGLESYLEQATLLHSIETAPLYRQVEKIARNPSSLRKQTSRALYWYLKGDIHQLYRLTKSSMHGLRKRIIYDRNQIMLKRILDFSPVKKYFIVVGAGHLSGKYGLLAGLKHAGWRIHPVPLLTP